MLGTFFFQFVNIKQYLWKWKLVLELVFLIVSHTKVSKLYFHKCAHFFLSLSLSTFFIHHLYSYTKILTLIPLIPTPFPCIPILISHIPIIPILIPCIPIIPTMISGITTLIPHISIIPLISIPDSSFQPLQIAR